MSKRDSQILEILSSEKRVEVASLAERLGVSNVTMRKDLDELQAKGALIREHGFATLASPEDISGRLAYHYDEKCRIADRALELVPDGSSVMIESGSCVTLLARRIAERRSDVTLITNSAFIAGYLRDIASANVTLLGGVYQHESQEMVGPLVRECARGFVVDRLFIGADGWLSDIGFTSNDQLRAEAVRDMANQAGEVIVLTESEKFSRHGLAPLRLGSKLTAVITDSGIDDAARKNLEAHGATVLLADE